jgi:outer membrane protein insertion porin family
VDVNTSKYNRVIAVNTTDPYFTQDGISRTIDLYHRNAKPYETQGGNYSLATTGLGLRFGIPFSEFDTVFFGANIERTEINPGTNIPAAYLFYASKIGGFTSTSLPFTVGWARDSRDSALAPTNGRLQRLNGELGLIGDNRYWRANYQFQQYLPLNKQYTVAFNSELGIGRGLSGHPFPVFKNFYSGGLGSVRGFEQSTLGPRDITGSVLGGTRKVTVSTELYTPFPGAGNDRTLRLFGFLDVGNVYGESDQVRLNEMRASIGAGVSWVSPIGPLRFALAQPIRKFAGDRIQRIQFQIGTSF